DAERVKIRFLVTDTGIGIKKTDIPKLFNRFSQVDNHYTRKVEGTGLGLALSKELAKLLHGDLTVTSEVGVGSCFCIEVEQKARHYYDVSKNEELKDIVAYIYALDNAERWYLTRILSQLTVPSVLLHDKEELLRLKEYKSKDNEKQILFYSYEQNHEVVDGLELPVRKIALMQYYTSTKEMNLQGNFLRSPYDIFKVLRAILSVEEQKAVNALIQTKDAHIAVVDDNKVNLKVVITLLKQFDVRPEAFASGAGILKALEHGREYDVIFMDHMMPEMDGVETTRKIREMDGEYAKRAIIIALTANAIDGVEDEYIEAGMNDWLFKPVNTERIQEKLIKYLPKEKIVV
ncbi:MAG: response regulator, partial [Lachnospiraceae bacterium]|nr:response regulator [Lachnospiraceae bacterium]